MKTSLKYHKQINKTIYTAITKRSGEITPAYCDIRGSNSGTAEYRRILRLDDESLGEQFPPFRSILVPYSSESKIPQAIYSTSPMTQYKVLEILYIKHQHVKVS